LPNILSVKDNRPTPHKNIGEFFEGMENGEIPDMPEDVAACMPSGRHPKKATAGLKHVK
jgi:hypothetical protein